MSAKEMERKVTELKELKAMQEELQAEITALEDIIKAEMQRIGSDTLQAGIFKVLYKTVKTYPLRHKSFQSNAQRVIRAVQQANRKPPLFDCVR